MAECELRIYRKYDWNKKLRDLRAHESFKSFAAARAAVEKELEMVCDGDGDLFRVYGGRHTEEVRFCAAPVDNYECAIALPDGREFPLDEFGCGECGCDTDEREGWVEIDNGRFIEQACPGACASAMLKRWAKDEPIVHVTIGSRPNTRKFFAARVLPFTYIVLDEKGEVTGELVTSNQAEATERPARLQDSKLEIVKQYAIREKGWSQSNRVRGLHGFIVGELLNPRYGLVDGLCSHTSRTDAERCKAHREAGGDQCVDYRKES